VEIALFVVLVVAVVVLGRHWGKKADKERRGALTEAAQGFLLDAELDPSNPTLSGRVDGLEVTFRLVTRGTGSNARSWTECEVQTSTEQLDIALREQTRGEERWVDKGLARDVVVSDADFDAKFIVEAAPEDLAKRALSADIRRELLAHHPLALKSRSDGLLFEKLGWIEKPDAIRAFTAMAVHLAASMEAVVGEARDDAQRAGAQTSYRGATPQAERASELDAREQTAELKALRVEREKAATLRHRLMMAAVLVALLALSFADCW
jgi:hypothetical protein